MNIWHGLGANKMFFTIEVFVIQLGSLPIIVLQYNQQLIPVEWLSVLSLYQGYMFDREPYMPLRSSSLIDKLPHSQACVASGRNIFHLGADYNGERSLTLRYCSNINLSHVHWPLALPDARGMCIFHCFIYITQPVTLTDAQINIVFSVLRAPVSQISLIQNRYFP